MLKAPEREIVLIAGPTCSGKTSLARDLQDRMPVTVASLSLDEYDLFPVGSEAMKRELVEGNIANWEDPSLFDMEQFVGDLGRIAQGHSFELQTRSRDSLVAGEENRTFVPRRTNIVEGIVSLHDPRARALMNLSIFVDIPLEVMVERRLTTTRPGSVNNPWDEPEYISGAMIEATKRFILPQRDHAQVVLDGMLSTQELAGKVMHHLLPQLIFTPFEELGSLWLPI